MRIPFLNSTSRWLLTGALIGLITAVVALVFIALVNLGSHYALAGLAGVHETLPAGEPQLDLGAGSPVFRPLLLLAVLFGAGCLAGGLVQFVAKGRQLGDTDYVVESYHQHRGQISVRAWLINFASSIVTMVGGGAVGREGPMILAGATVGSTYGHLTGHTSRNRRLLLVAGSAAGIAAAFHAPLAGALYAGEMLYSDSDLDTEGLIPAIIAAITAYCAFGLLEVLVFPASELGSLAIFQIPQHLTFTAHDFLQLVGYGLVALGTVGFSFYMRSMVPACKRLFARIPLALTLRAGLGALVCGLLALAALYTARFAGWIPADGSMPMSILGPGYGALQHAFWFGSAFDQGVVAGPVALALVLLLIAVIKVPATAVTLGSGCSGGLFAPSMVIGGCVGGAIGLLLQGLAIGPAPAACVVMGMAGILAANFKTPLAALMMVCELTGSYQLLLPAMFVSVIAFLFSGRRGLIHSQVPHAIDSPAHSGHFFTDILAGITVNEVFDPQRRAHTLHPDSSLQECKMLVTQSQQNIYPVVDDEGRMTGLFTMDDLRAFLYDEALELVVVAQDIATTDLATICGEDSLGTAMRRFTERNLDALPVVVSEEDPTFLGLLERRAVIAYYNGVVEQLRKRRSEEGWDDPRQSRSFRRSQLNLPPKVK
jgi:CIC family chloride channel protein